MHIYIHTHTWFPLLFLPSNSVSHKNVGQRHVTIMFVSFTSKLDGEMLPSCYVI